MYSDGYETDELDDDIRRAELQIQSTEAKMI